MTENKSEVLEWARGQEWVTEEREREGERRKGGLVFQDD